MTSQKPGNASQGPLQIGRIFIWQYEILQLIGSGGHAFVYRARHRFLGHLVAIKVLHRAAGVSLEMLRRGQAEAQIEFQLKHPGIVSVLDAGIDNDGLLYIVMELLHGRSVRDALLELGRLGVNEVLALGTKVALAMEVAHRAGVVHRDLKPENLFFTRHDNEPKVVDFGIAKIDDAAGWQTQKDMVMGTVYYMSPEQVMAQPVTPRSDIYSLGTILCEALLGQPPVLRQVGSRPLTFKLLTRIIGTEQLPPLNELDPRIPAYVDKLITRATAKRPEERFASMRELADACRACLRAYEAEVLQRGSSLAVRDLSRKTPSASGVETLGTPSAAPLEHDTAPASRPPFFGGLSSSAVTVAAHPQATTQTAPLGVEPHHEARAEASTPESTREAEPRLEERAVPLVDGAGNGLDRADSRAAVGLSALLWGAAVGIVVFGAGAFFFLQPRRDPSPARPRAVAPAASMQPVTVAPRPPRALPPVPNPAIDSTPSLSGTTPITMSMEPGAAPSQPALPSKSPVKKPPEGAPARESIF